MIQKLFKEILNTQKHNQTTKTINISQDYLYSINEKYALVIPYFLLKVNMHYNAFKRLIWLLVNQPEYFYGNIKKIAQYGSYKALWEFMSFCDAQGNKIDKEKVYEFFKKGLENEIECNKVKKHLPSLYSLKESEDKSYTTFCTQVNVRGFMKYMGWKHKDYRKCKSSYVPNESKKWFLPYKVEMKTKFKNKLFRKLFNNDINNWTNFNIQTPFLNETLCILDVNKTIKKNKNALKLSYFYSICLSRFSKHMFKNKIIMFNKSQAQFVNLCDDWMQAYKLIPKKMFSGNISLEKVIDKLIEIKNNNTEFNLNNLPKQLLFITSDYYNENTQNILQKIKNNLGENYANQLQIFWWNVTAHHKKNVNLDNFIVEMNGCNYALVKKIFKVDKDKRDINTKFEDFVNTF